MNNALNTKGLTLVELLVAIVISTIVIGGAYSAYTALYKSVIISQRHTESEQGTYRKIDMITSTIRRSPAVLALSPNKITLETSDRDSLALVIRNDTIFRQPSDSLPRFWFTMDSCAFEYPLNDSGWIIATIRGSYPGRFAKSHAVKRSVTLFRKPEKIRENEWGF